MSLNNFNELIDAIKDLDSSNTRKAVQRKYRPVAKDFNKHIITFLQNKDYPLRQGQIVNPITNNRIDPIYGKTPTERLHGITLAEAQKNPSIRKITKVINDQSKIRGQKTSARVSFNNEAPHAEWFFEETRPHTITPGENPLAFWAGFKNGQGVPWHPAKTLWNGAYTTVNPVNHPGTQAYHPLITAIFEQQYQGKFSNLLTSVTDTITQKLSRLFRK
jgi:hypothetical protein